ncbi:heparinase II/III family protein [Bacillus sp. AL-1R]
MKDMTLRIKNKEEIDILRLVTKLNNNTLLERCDDLLCDVLLKDKRYPKVKIEGDNCWIINPCDRSWRFWFHSLKYLEYLIDGFKVFGEKKYLEKAIDIILDWKKHNFHSSESEMAWHDHSTALRLIIICKVYEIWRQELWNDEIYEEFYELVNVHCTKLTDPDFYMEKHNHGMDQDIALLIASVVFFQMPEATFRKELSLKRFERQLNHLFMSDGSYSEHSPHYVYMLGNRLFNVLSFIKENKIENNGNLERILNKSMKYLAYTLQPDGQFPPIGDSVMLPIEPNLLKDPTGKNLSEIEYISSNGINGKQPDQLDTLFPDGGYASLRNKWEFDQETIQSIFYSSFHSRVHKHHDDLSITIFGHGQPLLVDSGKYNYVYDSPERQYVVSTKAHNTVTVDGENTNTSRNNIGKSGLTSYCFNQNFSFVSGIHCLYPGVVHQRLFLFLKPYDFVVIDRLQGYKEHDFQQNFHFDPSINCQNKNGIITGIIEGNSVISLKHIHKSKDISVKLVKGLEDPLLGWVSQSYAKLEPTFCMNSQQNGRDADFATQISLNPEKPLNIKFAWEDDIINVRWNENNLKIIMATNQEYLVLNDQFINMNYINQPKIKEAIKEQKNFEYREKYRAERQRRLRYYDELVEIKQKLKE